METRLLRPMPQKAPWTGAAWIVASLLLPLVSADGPDSALGERLDLDGTTRLDADLDLWSMATDGEGASLRLVADFVDVSSAEAYYPNLTENGRMAYPPLSGTQVTLQDVRMSASPWMRHGGLAVVPLEGYPKPTVAMGIDQGSLRTSAPDCVASPGPSEAKCWVTPAAVTLDGLPSRPMHLSIEGSFFLWIWGWQGTSDHAAGNDAVWSGRMTLDPSQSGSPIVVDRFAVTGFTVTDGRLAVDLPDADVGTLTFDDAFLEMDGPVHLKDHQGRSVLDSSVPAMTVTNEGGWLRVASASTGLLAKATVPAIVWILMALLGVLAVVAVVVAVVALRRGDPVLQALRARNHAQAAGLALRGGPSKGPEEAVTRAVAYIHAGMFDVAERELRAYALPEPDLKFIMACLRAKQGRDVEARALLAESVQLEPAYALEARFNADLVRVSGPGGQPGGYS